MHSCLGCLPVMRTSEAPAALGATSYAVRQLLDEGTLVRVRRGVVAGACVVERAREDRRLGHEVRLRALMLTYPECVAAYESAAVLHRLPLLDVPSRPVLVRPGGAWRGGDVGRVRIAPVPPHHRAVVGDMCATTAERTVVDLIRSASWRAAVVVGDAALRAGCSPSGLAAVLEECLAWSDVGKARRVLAFLDPAAESPLESVSRVVMREYGVPPPQTQVWLDVGAGVGGYRVDFLWEQRRVVGEADGLGKYDDPGALRAEKVRQEHLERAGYRVVRWTWREMLHQTDATIARLRRALER